ncbi:hypothetical protein [Candidiatus Paracoxiella cheracis]|uniref:hypothetical protein n=1 Tax=Candidiatus Paracoxiella cheracis TaxID=3405120 RepID=UPI003BF6064C
MIVAVVGVGSLFVMNNQMTVGGLAACMLLATRCIQPISTLLTVWSRLKLVAIANKEIQSLLELPLESKPGLPVCPKLKGGIELHGVSFRYEKEWILKDANLAVNPYECVAIELDFG